MPTPPLLSERSRPVQVLLAVVAPILLGAVAGILIGVSAGLYILVSVIAAIGAYIAGLEHFGASAAARRGALAGLLYGAALLITHQIEGSEELVYLASPPVLLALLTTGIGALLAALGGSHRAKQEVGEERTIERE
jgi:hypothetical protein